MRRNAAVVVLIALVLGIGQFLFTNVVQAQAISLVPVKSGFSKPVFATQAPGDPNRLFVVEQDGLIKTVDLNNLAAAPQTFLNIDSQVLSTAQERGLLGMAFAPDYSSTGRFYTYYTRDGATAADDGDIVIARHQATLPMGSASYSGATTANVGTPIITIEHTLRTNHNGGWLGFRPGEPNNLYAAVGDGGGGNDPDNNGQNRNTLLGKLLRLNVSGDTGYTIPAGNPYAGATPGADEVWAIGLRNPFRNSFDRQTGVLYIADVGQGAREEVNREPANSLGGVNYGWDIKEGTNNTGNDQPANGGTVADATPFTGPLFEYNRDLGGSITGGYVYRGPDSAALQGTYFFADYVSNSIFTINPVDALNNPSGSPLNQSKIQNRTLELGFDGVPTSFGEGLNGELYLVSYIGNNGGEVFEIVPEPSSVALLIGGVVCGGVTMIAKRRRKFAT